jgi:flagellum-specific ATP synthase
VTPALLARVGAAVRATPTAAVHGRVVRVVGLTVEATLPGARVGDMVDIERDHRLVAGEVVGFRDGLALVVPFSDVRGVSAGAAVRRGDDAGSFGVGEALLGRVIDPFGVPLDGGLPARAERKVPVEAPAPSPAARARISEPFETGVRVIDGLLTCGRGQRVGVFAGAGVGKTVLIRQILQHARADVIVVGLVGERGCEVLDLLHAQPMDRAVMVVATSDRSPLERARGALAATAVAEHFRDRGRHVLLVVDSLTRYAMALREIGLSAGESPATKGYPPSVFSALPRLLERAAPLAGGGSITAFYTVLVEGDDLADPVADAARSLLDAHIVLSRDLAGRGHFPAVDVLASASRVARQVSTPAALALAQAARSTLATRREIEELRSLGAYVAGANPAHDRVLALGEQLDDWARQDPEERSDMNTTRQALARIFSDEGER